MFQSAIDDASHPMRTFRAFVLAAGLACVIAPLHAQPAAAPAPSREIGAALRWQPVVDGTDTRRTDVIPLFDLAQGPWFARTTRGLAEGGVRVALGEHARVGAQLAFEPGRAASKDDVLSSRGVTDIGAGVSYGAFAEVGGRVGPVPIGGLLRIRLHGDADLGSQVDLRVTFGLAQAGTAILAGFGQLTWADELSNDAYFGVSPALSARSGWPTYTASGGVRQLSAGLLGSVGLTPEVSAVATLEVRALQESAAASPLARRRHATSLVVGLTYAF
jgi:outer membrane scaffolding protein for murein synthesis (MipA/OmpV family)